MEIRRELSCDGNLCPNYCVMEIRAELLSASGRLADVANDGFRAQFGKALEGRG
jgi:hypothetical protein